MADGEEQFAGTFGVALIDGEMKVRDTFVTLHKLWDERDGIKLTDDAGGDGVA